MVERQFLLNAGDGGDALIGSGGRGGSIGAGSTLVDIIDPVTGLLTKDFQGSIEIVKSGRTRLIAGFGGDGFSAGGIGGSVTGVSLRSDGERTGGILRGGDGGRGVTGKGGIGGDVANNSIFGGQTFTAGAGGPGIFGGKGGSVLGNGTEVYDTNLQAGEALSDGVILFVTAGAGGTGTRGGGGGGDILNFHPTINLPQPAGDLSYIAGAGGNSVSGSGGNGGSIRNSSPALNALMEGEVFLQAGIGGNGSKGGNGGEVTEFRINLAAQANSAAVVSVLGGSGGFGSKGNGGTGGLVNGIDVSSRGVPNFGLPLLSAYSFNRILGGEGGDSAKKRGGNGGSVENIRTSADQGGYAIVAGAGGDALIKGGIGGDLTNIDVTFGASTTAKGLFIAGDGGSATAFVDNPNDPNDNGGKNAFGGKIGKGRSRR
jgi:hypothetical protein